ncbi:MAG: pyridine nucleotide-disulfide oxidoreductase [Deltaproteobacteria bacterium]|nr:MAG: pyridine nucleotide-disulfide oxidoreductase [Deltaproteobacteria bacterium]
MPQHVVIIGAVALGPKAACRFKRLEPESRVTMIDQTNLISYGGCGIPYFVSGDISSPDELQSTSFHMLRDKKFFKDAKDIDVITKTKVTRIHKDRKLVVLEDIDTGALEEISYDQLVLATGSNPRIPSIDGIQLKGVYTVSNLEDAIAIRNEIAEGNVENAVIIGAGAIGLEMAEAMTDLWGIETTIVEAADQLLPGLISKNMAIMAQRHMEENDITFHFSQKVLKLQGQKRVEKVITNDLTLKADLVVIATGVIPNDKLAREAGLEVAPRGGIVVDEYLRTSDQYIYAGGDCALIKNLVTGKPDYFPSGSLANRQGRVIGTNLAGGKAKFEGAVGTFIIKLFDISVGSVGLSLARARQEGFNAVNTLVVQFDRAHFYPEKDLMYLELTVEKHTGRVLGIQGLGNKGDGMFARLSAVAPILRFSPTVEDIGNLELPYSPPFSAAMDILNALGNTAQNLLEGKNRVVDPDEFVQWWNERDKGETFFLDCRGWGNAQSFVEKYPEHWKSIPQDELRARLHEVPRDKRIALICNTGVRSYEAQITLDQFGIRNTFNLQGGMAAVKKLGEEI